MIVDELIKLQQTKAAIKQALIDKGQNPTDEFASYADVISGISGGSNPPSDILNMLGYNSTNAPDLYNALLSSLNKEEGATYTNDTSVLLPKLTLDENGIYPLSFEMFRNSTILTVPKGKYRHRGLGYLSMFQGCTSLMWIPDLELFEYDSNTYSCSHMFQGCTSLRTVGNLKMEACESAYHMFEGCSNLESIASLDTGNVTTMGNMFNGCKKLKSIPQLDTSKVTDMGGMFDGCTNLKSIPQLDTGNVTIMGGMFSDCSALESLPQLDTSKVTSMGFIFRNCTNLNSIPQWDFRAATDLNYGFSGCSLLTEIPDLNLDSVTNVSSLFEGDRALVTIGVLNTPKVTNITCMLQNCPSIEKITSLDVRAVTNNSYIIGFSGTIKPLKYMLLKNLGQSSATSWGLGSFPNWGVNDDKYPDARQSLIDTLITYSYDRVSAGMSTCTIKLNSNVKALLTEDEIAQITAKGFTIS